MASWDSIDELGRRADRVSSPPTQLIRNERLSYKDIVISTTRPRAEFMYLKVDQTEGRISRSSENVYTIEVIGDDIKTIHDVIMRLRQEIGEVNISPMLPRLPNLMSFFERCKFLFWDYLIKGKAV